MTGRVGPRGRSTLAYASESGEMFQATPVRVHDQGECLTVDWHLVNLGNTRYTVSSADARLVLDDGEQVGPRPGAAPVVLEPEDDATVTAVFDVPAGAMPSVMELDAPPLIFPFRWELDGPTAGTSGASR